MAVCLCRSRVLWSFGGMGKDIRALGLLVVLVVACLWPQASHAAWWWPFGKDKVEYRVEFTGVDEEALGWFKELKLDERKGHELENADGLTQELAVRGDRVKQALDAIGYYDAMISQSLRTEGEDKDRPVLVYAIQPGPRYTVGRIVLEWQGAPLQEIDTATLRSKVNEPVNAKKATEDGVDLLARIGQNTCLLALDVAPVVKVYENRTRVDLVFRIKHGAVANFGPTDVSGTRRVSQEAVMRSVTWKEGECYREVKVDETRTNLIQNQLFSSVNISHTTVPDDKGEVPMLVVVRERVARTLKSGLSYSTDEGVVGTVGWEHRNLLGNGEKFNANLRLGTEEQGLDTSLRLPDFFDDKTSLVLNAGYSHEDRDAYTADTVRTGASLERELATHWRGGVGIGYTLTQTDDKLSGESEYGLLSFPTFLQYDSRNDVLDPKRGVFANVNVTPYTETFGDGGQFIKTQGNLQTYLSAALPLSPTLALKVTGGTITGADGQDVPSDLRFYAGGGGSVRGYGYQTLGPRVDGTVVGGSSLLTASAETRFRINDTFGFVAFMDAGNAFDDTLPDRTETLYTSAGVGLRYFTGIGPIRADIAFPLNGDDVGAAGYAVYISIGQSF